MMLMKMIDLLIIILLSSSIFLYAYRIIVFTWKLWCSRIRNNNKVNSLWPQNINCVKALSIFAYFVINNYITLEMRCERRREKCVRSADLNILVRFSSDLRRTIRFIHNYWNNHRKHFRELIVGYKRGKLGQG